MKLLREARVDLGAIASNVQTLLATAGVPGMAVVKADGYGHGAVPVAQAALDAGATWLGVVDLVEALALREAGITAPILTWLHDPATDFSPGIAAGIDLGVSSLPQLERVAAAEGRAFVHLKIDTGLGRNGADAEQWQLLVRRAAELERAGALVVRGIFSHLAGSPDDGLQVQRFRDALVVAEEVGLRPELRHLAASAGTIGIPDARFDLVRLGIGMYGLNPFCDGRPSAEFGLRPAMELAGRVVAVKRVAASTGVSYGYTYRTAKPSTLALVGLGYADGIPRHGSNGAPVSINGTRYAVAGRIAMDQFVVDLGDDFAEVGDRVVLFGDPATGVPSADEWADAAGTINYEIVTRLGSRIRRTYR
ncbi:alanine racemase [Desertivibrio insolitus]|uniref:alanine racemase n=1 Tax=Herbiconiux sp. SYSU D00978 TaxID=2812562 RepID=UPI001A95C43D|nr:alanine racemase [Herbiconiux sp. SYSU D00978]